MTWIAGSLWDLIVPRSKRPQRNGVTPADKKPARRADRQPVNAAPTVTGAARAKKSSMQDRYDALVEEMKAAYNVRVRKWRKSSSGVAWTIRYIRSGRVVKLIEAPYPRGPMSCAIFLHEIGHHAIGLGVYKPRCLEEFHVWVWALDKMREQGFNVTPAVEKRMERSMRYAIAKARRRGIREVPAELQQYL